MNPAIELDKDVARIALKITQDASLEYRRNIEMKAYFQDDLSILQKQWLEKELMLIFQLEKTLLKAILTADEIDSKKKERNP